MRLMRNNVAQLSITQKLVFTLLFLFFLILIIRSNFSNSPPQIQTHLSNNNSNQKTTTNENDCSPNDISPVQQTCTKTPSFLAKALVHYVTTNVTPQQTLKEISVSMRILEKKSPCNFLVFGLGHDSLMWAALNHGGRTVFLEEDKSWIEQIRRRIPGLESYHVAYDTKLHQADELMKIGAEDEACKVVGDPRFSTCRLALKNLPSDVYDTEWDLIMVDAPTGWVTDAPGRMTAIYTAGIMARNRESGGESEVFVHDVDRPVEDKFSKAFLCEGYLTQQEGRLRHFTIPSHRGLLERPFCP
ncbi:hypothetical protein CsatB_015522 [Cannabis sativa]|uniref:Polysaccharide biosynthesis domain-containing protein n=2 Tax=Cannabis sativa TaxID=3483 RepID=A0A7J6FXH2_CANSA|nr:hypothetical protein F8388_024103 [Cannabis sativa]KAF4383431.1 hypothetical protein G4B88_024005 [Cannabis sativa]